MKNPNLGVIKTIHCEEIRPLSGQPRSYFDKKTMDDLEASIRKFGQRKPGIVKTLGDSDSHGYEILDGERRFRVCKKIGIPYMAWVNDNVTDNFKDKYLESIIQNYGNAKFTDWETFYAITYIRDNFDYTLAEIAACFGKSVGFVNQYLSLAKLHPDVFEMMDPQLPDKKRLSFSHALALTKLSEKLQLKYARNITQEGLKLKVVKQLVEKSEYQNKSFSDLLPNKEYQKFQNFLDRTMVDLGIFSCVPNNYFRRIFESRSLREVKSTVELIEREIEILNKIKEILVKAKNSNLEVAI